MIYSFAATCLLWWKLIYWFRFYEKTSFYIKLIIDTIFDIRFFFLIFVTFLLGFGNVILILDENRNKGDDKTGITEDRLFTQNFDDNRYLDAVLNQYLLSLGEFGLTTFSMEGSKNSGTVWGLFLIGTFLTQITIFNMLIAIMGDTYANVTENRVEAALE